jgi:transposase
MHQARHEGDSYQRVEVITGSRRRRSWSESEKARIIAESAALDANVSEVARRNGVSRGLLTVWRRQARLEQREGIGGGAFAAVHIDDGGAAAVNDEAPIAGELASRTTSIVESGVSALATERIEIAIADVTVRVPANVDARTLARVLTALRSTR